MASVQYALPDERIAQQPLPERDASKLLTYTKGTIRDRHFRDLAEELPGNALLVLNDTRVVNARVVFQRSTGARIEILCLEPAEARPVEQAFRDRGRSEWKAFVGNAKRWKEGEELIVRSGHVICHALRTGTERIAFRWTPDELSFSEVLELVGHVPLPPYMKRQDADADKVRYNTVFAHNEGSVAAPTASLHFTPSLLERLHDKGVRSTRLTLHVGAGTFLPVKTERMADHHMHQEQVRIPLDALEDLVRQLGQGPVVAVGTTALRTLESIYWHGVALLQGTATEHIDVDQWQPYETPADRCPDAAAALQAVIGRLHLQGSTVLTGATRLLIAPGYTFRYVDGLITNFHQPGSTLLLLVAAFVGPDWRRIYDHALVNDYRFLSYGDGSVLWR